MRCFIMACMHPMPGTDLAAQPIPLTRPATGESELAAVADVFRSGWLAGQGPHGTALEDGFKELTGRRHAIALNNCTAALHLALVALGVGPGQEVLVSDYSFPATGHAVLYCDASPVFVDVRADTGTIDTDLVEDLITPKTSGIVAVDALGMPADWDRLEEITSRHGLFLVEDAACAAGGVYAGRPCGSFGDVAVFSLHARKGITCGEGGVLTTDDATIAQRVRAAGCFGMESAFARQSAETLAIPEFPELGYNYKLSDVLAAIAAVQLGKLEEFSRRRRAIAARYNEMLAGIPGIIPPRILSDRIPTWQTYAVTVQEPLERDAIALALRAEGIGCNIGTYAMHLQSVYGATDTICPVSDRLFRQHLALPMYTDLTDAEQDRVVDTLCEIVEQW
jgi:dTDP-4-amino-4,6-dideoxygalactose transaminase